MKKNLISMFDLSKDDISSIINLAIDMKNNKEKYSTCFSGKTLAMIFAKSSTRTRLSFEMAMISGGGHAIFLNSNDIQLGRGESIYDTAKVLSRYIDAIMIRTYKHSDVETLGLHSDVPVINALTDDEHPCQILADLMTIQEHKKTFDLKVAYFGDGNNVAASFAIACSIMGIECVIASPEDYTVDKAIREKTKNITYTSDVESAAKYASVVYTDTWISMGQEAEYEQKVASFGDYQVNEKLVSLCKDDYIFLHCLPAYRGKEVTEAIIDGSIQLSLMRQKIECMHKKHYFINYFLINSILN